ncbi:DUF3189 family protein [Caldisalinibacter kiritimatiensis]|uniref:DUF3189 family protein n=1 Tax=Caldisalinibacter kiritimatiensis TaxID=1304284 RepID=R1CEH7_9FIRM|nr:DUF3189 family protein [Caldisalinibacter kiritimatiensis]EOD00700.1 hypothetical protein L21TH_1301 [Caldisalinibacter kiritimatiensis]
MHIIYHCVGGTHSSAIAAAIHLGILPKNEKPNKKQILDIPYFDTLTKSYHGKIIFRGTDKNQNKVYTLSRQFAPDLVIPAVKDAWKIAGANCNELLLVDTMPAVNIWMKIGGFSSRRLNLVSFGRPIVTKGTQIAFFDIVKIVDNTINKLSH